LIAIVLPSIAFFAKARQPKTKPRIIASNQSPSLPVNNANQGNAIVGRTGRQATKTGKKRLGNNKAIANTGLCTA
jgi:hypothetical protein